MVISLCKEPLKSRLVCEVAFFVLGQPAARGVWPRMQGNLSGRPPSRSHPDGGSLPTEARGHAVTFWESGSSVLCTTGVARVQHAVSGDAPPGPGAGCWMCHPPHAASLALGDLGGSSGCGCRGSQRRAPRVCQSCALPPVIPCICFLELSKSQNDMTSDKQLRATGPMQHAGRTERRSQSDTAINVTTRVLPKAPGPPREPLPTHVLYRFSLPLIL